jgi:bis(5'-nucleosyl)-tetraphosphatase (symmetrical)
VTIWAIGDIQGCFEPLRRLLERLEFDPARDRLWFTGDLVNRGPNSLETLRFVKNLGEAALTVLGNHDLHLLAVAAQQRKAHRHDTLHGVLDAPDTEELLDWLRRQPLLHREAGWVLIHAGLPPQWDIETAQRLAREVESALQGPDCRAFFAEMYGDAPELWSEDLKGWARLRFITNCLTRMRYCDKKGRINLKEKGAPGTQPDRFLPWFAAPGRRSREARIVFGHWSTLGFYAGENCFGLDSGCLWGGELTALRLDDGAAERVSVPCPAAQRPNGKAE